MRLIRRLAFIAAMMLTASPAAAQQLGQKLLGGIGIDAGTQAAPGFYLLDRFGYYSAGTLRNQSGNEVLIRGLDIDAYGNVFGFAVTVKPQGAPYLTLTAGIPVARLSINSSDPRTSLDRSGFGDLFLQPLKVGWRGRTYDVTGSYSVYIPTGKFERRSAGGIGRGFWTHEFSLGSAYYISKDRLTRMSALASFDINSSKRDIDIKRGNTIHIQGGAGAGVVDHVTLGVAGFALWQVSADRGSDIPRVLRGLRTRAFGLGPEVNVLIPELRVRAELRYETEFGVRSRMDGGILVAGLTYQAWPVRRTR